MSEKFVGYLARSAGAKFVKEEFEAGELPPEHVEIDIKYGGVCHSDLSMWKKRVGHFRISIRWRTRSSGHHI